MEELRDIKDIVSVEDYSFEILLIITLFSIAVVSFALYFYKNRRKRRKKMTKREIALNSLKSIDYKNQKEVAYRFTIDGAMFVNEKNEQEFKDIKEKLIVYKYKKDVPKLDRDLETRVKEFIKGLK
jgi:Flp pilus assembly protein TadB